MVTKKRDKIINVHDFLTIDASVNSICYVMVDCCKTFTINFYMKNDDLFFINHKMTTSNINFFLFVLE